MAALPQLGARVWVGLVHRTWLRGLALDSAGRPDLVAEDEERFEPLMRETLGAGIQRLLETFERFEEARPSEPHYYLSLLGTHPDKAGQGWGMGLLADNLARIESEGATAYLESSNPT